MHAMQAHVKDLSISLSAVLPLAFAFVCRSANSWAERSTERTKNSEHGEQRTRRIKSNTKRTQQRAATESESPATRAPQPPAQRSGDVRRPSASLGSLALVVVWAEGAERGGSLERVSISVFRRAKIALISMISFSSSRSISISRSEWHRSVISE